MCHKESLTGTSKYDINLFGEKVYRFYCEDCYEQIKATWLSMYNNEKEE